MTVIDFHSQANRFTYAAREAAADWAEVMRNIVDTTGKRVLDIGCGGGIYSAQWAQLGAKSVVGIDFSDQMLIAAREKNAHLANISFRKGSALETGLPDGCADIVFERALIHHISDRPACFGEAYRVLAPGGVYIVQDRTPDDVRLPASPEHIRGFFVERFPRLLDIELGRRPEARMVAETMMQVGFEPPNVNRILETRRTYNDFDELAADLRGRTGRSILHALNDHEIDRLIDHVRNRVPTGPLVEREPWTIWSARRT
jgi:ubiquinone/menaquinone biosynthesis C-methylase UbiE